MEDEEVAVDVAVEALSEQKMDLESIEAPTGGQLPADGSAEEDAVVEPVAVVLELE